MSEVSYKEIRDEEEGQRLDNYLFRLLKGVPKSHIYRIIRGGEVRVNKKRAQPSLKLQARDSIRVPPIRTSGPQTVVVSDFLAERLHECVIFEDSNLLIINKPNGIAVHGGSGLSFGVIEALRKTRQDLSYLELVHRLDKDTSGCLLLAKKRSTLRAIQALLAAREVRKTYWAILSGSWTREKKITVTAALEKYTLKSGQRMVNVCEEGKASLTEFKLLQNFQNACWLEVSPKTGRTHQIRVHSAYIGHPVIGDEKYGQIGNETGQERLYLHARSIAFQLNGKQYYFQAEVDASFTKALQQERARSVSIHE